MDTCMGYWCHGVVGGVRGRATLSQPGIVLVEEKHWTMVDLELWCRYNIANMAEGRGASGGRLKP